MAAEYNTIRFNSHKNIAIKKMREKKRSNKNIRCNGVRLNNWGWTETLKNSFILVELGPFHKNGLPSLSVIRVTTH
jgi:hypothetical protein